MVWKRRMMMAAAVVVMGCIVPAVQADSLSAKKQQLNELQQEASQLSNQVVTAQSKANSLQSSITKSKATIASVSSAIAVNRQQLVKLSEELQHLSDEISQNESKLRADSSQLKDIIRAQYEDGTIPYLDVLVHATSFTDFLSRLDELSYVAKSEHALLDETQHLQDQLKTEQADQNASYDAVQVKNKQLQSLQQQYLQLQSQQEASLRHTTDQIHDAKQRQWRVESQIKLTKSQIQTIEEATLAAEQKMQDPGYVSREEKNLKSVNTHSLISYAENYVGLPYVWGGTTPSPGFDCSGFTQYVFRHFGIEIGRDTWTQYSGGVPVSRNNLRPGDLVFFSTYASGASHVGIYVGDDMMVDSEDAGLIVTHIFSDPYWSSRYIGARDYIKH